MLFTAALSILYFNELFVFHSYTDFQICEDLNIKPKFTIEFKSILEIAIKLINNLGN